MFPFTGRQLDHRPTQRTKAPGLNFLSPLNFGLIGSKAFPPFQAFKRQAEKFGPENLHGSFNTL